MAVSHLLEVDMKKPKCFTCDGKGKVRFLNIMTGKLSDVTVCKKCYGAGVTKPLTLAKLSNEQYKELVKQEEKMDMEEFIDSVDKLFNALEEAFEKGDISINYVDRFFKKLGYI